MSAKEALFTGTFDPFHIAHIWQLERAFLNTPFNEAIIGVIKSNTKKPLAAQWQHRVALAGIALRSVTLPFLWRIEPIDDIAPDTVRAYRRRFLEGEEKPLRIIGSDSLLEFANDHLLRPTLGDFSYLVMMRPETPLVDAERAMAELLKDTDRAFDGKLVTIPPHLSDIADVSARNIRGNVTLQSGNGLLCPEAVSYMRDNHLYEFSGVAA